MAAPSPRLLRRVRRDFGAADVDRVVRALGDVPESLPLGGNQDPERLQACLVLGAAGRFAAFGEMLQLAQLDWRDALVGSGLADADWRDVLDRELGPH